MPSAFKNPFGRRKSVGNALDFASPAESPDPSSSSTFRVIERADKSGGQHNFDGGERKLNSAPRPQPKRPFDSPLQQIRGKSAEDIISGQNRYDLSQTGPLKNPRLINQRGSRGTTNSGSSGHYDSSGASARYSSTSTLPSSVEPEREPEEEDLFPTKRATAPMFSSSTASPAPHNLPQPPSFTSRASRALSFGLKGKTPPPRLDDAPPMPMPTESASRSASPIRERAMTSSSYASTAVPQKSEPPVPLPVAPIDLPTADFGDADFGDMFDSFKERGVSGVPRGSPTPPALAGGFKHTVSMANSTARAQTHGKQESKPMFPPRSYSRQGVMPSPNELRSMRDNTASPYSLEGRRSNDGLMAGSAFNSPILENGPGIPAIAPAFMGGASRQGYAPVSEQMASPGAERLSFESHNSQREFVTGANKLGESAFTNRQTHLDDGDRWTKKAASKAPASSTSNSTAPTTSSSSTARQTPTQAGPSSSSRARANSHHTSEGGDWLNESRNATPKATKFAPKEESMFDETSPAGPPSRALRPVDYSQQRTESGTPKKMTKAQFEMLQKHGNKSVEQSEDESGSGDEYDDDGEEERAKQATQQRRKQEANMSVYRQQMKKVTGGGPSDLPSARPGMERAAQSASGFYLGGMNGPPPADAVRGKQTDEDDDEVPLGILQAHGFPSGSRPPMPLGGEYSQRASVAGSVVGGGGQGNLPAFARRLPQDPYFGAGLVNSTNRESLAYGGGGSVYGGPASPMGHPMGTPGGHPGGLVGVIAGEERAKAARRATPSAAYGAPLPSNMPVPMPRTMSMGNLPPPSIYGGQGMPPMPQMPQMPQMMPGQDSNAQMQQFMQMQMQFMQNMMAMQQQNMGQAPPMQMPQPGNGFLSPAPSRPMSMASQAPPNQRSMTMMGPPPTWNQQAQQNRPGSSFQHYAPSVQNLQAGPGAGYTPSIAPSERSNIGMPSRYRPVSTMNADGGAMMSGGAGRSQSMTSSMTLQAFTTPAPEEQARNGTIRVIDKPKGAPRIVARAVEPEEDEDQGWSEMAKKRSERKWKWGRSKKEQPREEGLGDLYQNVE
jgi:hypothetical protein